MRARLARRRAADPKRVRQRIAADLERRGVSGDFSVEVSRRLAPFLPELSADAYEGVLSGVALAYGVHRQASAASEGPELDRLLEGFVGELRKLDEALGTLAAYVSRIGQRGRTRSGPLH